MTDHSAYPPKGLKPPAEQTEEERLVHDYAVILQKTLSAKRKDPGALLPGITAELTTALKALQNIDRSAVAPSPVIPLHQDRNRSVTDATDQTRNEPQGRLDD